MFGAVLLTLAPALGASPQDPATAALLPGEPDRLAAIGRAGASADARFLPALIDLLAFAETAEEWYAILDALGALLSEDMRAVERPWRTLRLRLSENVSGPPDYLAFKRELLARVVDPRYRDLLADRAISHLPLERTDWGGVPVDGIPALLDPPVIDTGAASWLEPTEPVFGLCIDGEARAYPLRILDWHEMVNDRLGDTAFALSYCTLCGAGIAYRTGDADERDVFRSSGLLLDSNKLMFDEGTETLWSQLDGRALHGPRLDADGLDATRLELLAVDLVPWSTWLERHPHTTVVSLETGYDRDYTPGAAYGDYFGSSATMFPAPGVNRWLARAKERVLVVRSGRHAATVDAREAIAAGVAEVQVGEQRAIVLAGPRAVPTIPESWSAIAADARAWRALAVKQLVGALEETPARAADLTVELLLELPASVRLDLLDRDLESSSWDLSDDVRLGAAQRGLAADLRAFAHPGVVLTWKEGRLVDREGREWTATTGGLQSPDGRTYGRLASHLAFRFAVQD